MDAMFRMSTDQALCRRPYISATAPSTMRAQHIAYVTTPPCPQEPDIVRPYVLTYPQRLCRWHRRSIQRLAEVGQRPVSSHSHIPHPGLAALAALEVSA